jgi:hypothetical protein
MGISIRQLHQALPPFQRQGDTRGILEIWQDIDKLRTSPQGLLEVIGIHTLLVKGDGDVFCPIGVPGLQRSQVSRLLNQDMISGINEDLADQV